MSAVTQKVSGSEAWKRIQELKPCIAYADATLEEFDQIMDELSPVGLSLQTISPKMENARAKRDLVYQRATVKNHHKEG